jgi:hypothetical protein
LEIDALPRELAQDRKRALVSVSTTLSLLSSLFPSDWLVLHDTYARFTEAGVSLFA